MHVTGQYYLQALKPWAKLLGLYQFSLDSNNYGSLESKSQFVLPQKQLAFESAVRNRTKILASGQMHNNPGWLAGVHWQMLASMHVSVVCPLSI